MFFKRMFIVGCGAILTLLFFWVALAAVYSIPTSWIVGQVEESKAILKEESRYPPQYAAQQYGMVYDNFTVYIMLNLAIQPTQDPFADALASKRYYDADFDAALQCAIDGKSNATYSRYWHGYLIFLRPMLIFFNITQIRFICQLVFLIAMSTLIAWLALSKRRSGAVAGVLLALSFLSLGAAQATETLPIFPSFLLAMLGCGGAIYVSSQKMHQDSGEGLFTEGFVLFCFFGVLGSLTVFFDFLDNPVVVLCTPLSLYIFCERESFSARRALRVVALSILGWFAGYGLLWLGKWILASTVLGESAFEEAFNQAAFRSGMSEAGAEVGGPVKAIRENVLKLGFMRYALILVAVLALLCVIKEMISVSIVEKGGKNQKIALCCALVSLLLVSTLPYVWYIALSNHSIVHTMIAHRTQIGALFPWLLIIGLVLRRGIGKDHRETCEKNRLNTAQQEVCGG